MDFFKHAGEILGKKFFYFFGQGDIWSAMGLIGIVVIAVFLGYVVVRYNL